MPALAIFAWTVSVVPLGIVRGALDSFVELASIKGRLGASGLLRDREVVQATPGRAEAMLGAARAYLIETMTELMTATDIGSERLAAARLQLRTAGAHAAETALRIVDLLAIEVGSAGLFETGRLERAFRDVQAAARHVAMNPSIYLASGRQKLGFDLGAMRF
jgi:alkylation response protein AidB-like acyl-CoA dehydrogenase